MQSDSVPTGTAPQPISLWRKFLSARAVWKSLTIELAFWLFVGVIAIANWLFK
jgi:hypothetical protein